MKQPLTGRGLSRTVLTPPDILGERMQLEQLGLRRDALEASQRAKMPQPKFDEGEKFSFTEGKYFTPAQEKLINEYKEYMVENGVAANDANYGTPYFDERAYRKRKNMETNLARFLYQTKEETNALNKNIEDLDPREISVSGVLDWAEGVNRDINQTARFDESGNIVYGDGQDVFSSDYITKPESFYFTPVNWSKEALDEVVKPYIDVETGDITTKNLDLGKVRNQARGLLDLSDNRANFQKSFAASYLQENFGLDPRQVSGAVNTLVTEGQLKVGDEIISIDDVKGWAEDYLVEQVRNQAGFTRREDDGSGMEFNFGGYAQKLGAAALPAESREFASPDMKYGITLKTDKVQIPIDESIYDLGEDQYTEDIKSYVDNIYTDDQNVLVDVRGVRSKGSDLRQRGVPLSPNQVKQLQATMGLPNEVSVIDFIKALNSGEESVDSEQEVSPIEGYSMQDVKDAATQAGMSVDEYVRWYKENYE